MTSSEQANSYSPNWFEFFHVGINEERTRREIDFICRFAPRPEFQKTLDVCCGMGRHARALSERGYAVTGIDRDAGAIERARRKGSSASYLVGDIREYRPKPGWFDLVIVMGQSFGHFDAATNLDVLRRLAAGIRKRGRIILDLWNPEFFRTHQGPRELKTRRGTVCEYKRVDGNRLFVDLRYQNDAREKFEWQLFTPHEMQQLTRALKLRLLISSSGFDERRALSADDPRLQFVLQTG